MSIRSRKHPRVTPTAEEVVVVTAKAGAGSAFSNSYNCNTGGIYPEIRQFVDVFKDDVCGGQQFQRNKLLNNSNNNSKVRNIPKASSSSSNSNKSRNSSRNALFSRTESSNTVYIQEKIRELEREIDKLSNISKEAYFLALDQEIKQRTNYVRSEKFLLAFLRADNFDTKKAAIRLTKFFTAKLELFGLEKLPRRIIQQDVLDDPRDREVLYSGFLNINCGRDAAGRNILFLKRDRLRAVGVLCDEYIQNISRVGFYLTMGAIEDDDNEISQKRGFVGVCWNLNCSCPLKEYRILFSSFVKLFTQAVPLRFAGLHSCYNNVIERCVSMWRYSMLPKQMQLNSQNHDLSPTECLVALSNYGIDVQKLPLNPINGEFKLELHQSHLEEIRLKEEEQQGIIMATITSGADNTTTTLLPDSDMNENNHDENYCMMNMNNSNVENPPQAVSAVLNDPGLQEFRLLMKGSNIPDDDDNEIDNGRKSNSKNNTKKRTSSTKTVKGGFVLPNMVESQSTPTTSIGSRRSASTSNNCSSLSSSEDKLPWKLMEMLRNNSHPDAIWWLPNGSEFAIHKEIFPKKILSKHFKGIKLESFLRRLRRWGFHRVSGGGSSSGSGCGCNSDNNSDEGGGGNDENKLVYHHDLFCKNYSPSKLKKWSLSDIGEKPRKENLPVKLMKLLDSNTYPDAIWWLPPDYNTSFAVAINKFAQHVLTKEFEGIKLDSFYRMMRRWGFKRFSSEGDVIIYQHTCLEALAVDVPNNDSNDGAVSSSSGIGNKEGGVNGTTSSTLEGAGGAAQQQHRHHHVTSCIRRVEDNFPMKMYKLLEKSSSSDSNSNSNFKDAIWWLDDGMAFAIETEKFPRIVLSSKEFKGIKFSSFLRSLKRWGFKKEPKLQKEYMMKQKQQNKERQHVVVYQNPCFQKDKPHLLSKWSNKESSPNSNGNGSKSSISLTEENKNMVENTTVSSQFITPLQQTKAKAAAAAVATNRNSPQQQPLNSVSAEEIKSINSNMVNFQHAAIAGIGSNNFVLPASGCSSRIMDLTDTSKIRQTLQLAASLAPLRDYNNDNTQMSLKEETKQQHQEQRQVMQQQQPSSSIHHNHQNQINNVQLLYSKTSSSTKPNKEQQSQQQIKMSNTIAALDLQLMSHDLLQFAELANGTTTNSRCRDDFCPALSSTKMTTSSSQSLSQISPTTTIAVPSSSYNIINHPSLYQQQHQDCQHHQFGLSGSNTTTMPMPMLLENNNPIQTTSPVGVVDFDDWIMD